MHGRVSYKTLENAYGDADVIAILNDVFFLTQLPVMKLEHDFSMDGTCHPTTIKQNWESSKDEILRLAGKKEGFRQGQEEARVREDGPRRRNDVQDHGLLREDQEPVLQ
jgi:hypothetical protein